MEGEDAMRFFIENPAPSTLVDVENKVNKFIDLQPKDRNIVLVTSGGTLVPLEKNMVRYIDNFSAGNRGAASAEYFCKSGYAVIFLYRNYGMKPFVRHFEGPWTGIFTKKSVGSSSSWEIKDSLRNVLNNSLENLELMNERNQLLCLPYTTLTEYVWYLRTVAECLKCIRSRALFYLAAAVSDFHIPSQDMSEHKIQSGAGKDKLELTMRPVPKFLRYLVDSWAPEALIISFKLETDENILIDKARTALHRYNHQLVIANLLSTRRRSVAFVTLDSVAWLHLSDEDLRNGVEIEDYIVSRCVQLHKAA
ncbi:phosphopantothenate-cysteine ligase [Schizosaccharomyces cryophilus OY26]|uniref:Phosphopantothenate-cysteine ligase n=1 Tax=Schizosaccharomyces cryophilus (strain OY26 / ATCC MYA-4695 / CBS 11777 / NBRC 106824 / NRRL Y48691) TaxID=653667 RepID=S9X9Y1_SCHCR|nr:phosphopantothenate-cysteine ligase [Schizosaccharomyces cryophilus OY26]EPY50571.1 phosphopantothenate-cysteine ligase [Schizosaccharomyces cryophilus OY26]